MIFFVIASRSLAVRQTRAPIQISPHPWMGHVAKLLLATTKVGGAVLMRFGVIWLNLSSPGKAAFGLPAGPMSAVGSRVDRMIRSWNAGWRGLGGAALQREGPGVTHGLAQSGGDAAYHRGEDKRRHQGDHDLGQRLLGNTLVHGNLPERTQPSLPCHSRVRLERNRQG